MFEITGTFKILYMYIFLRTYTVAFMSISDGERQKMKPICQGVRQKIKKKKPDPLEWL